MRYNTVREQSTIDFVASTPRSLSIGSRDAWLVGLRLEFIVPKTDGASPTWYQDFFYRNISGILLADSQRTYIQASNPDARSLYWAVRNRMNGMQRVGDGQDGAVTLRHQLDLLFDPDPIGVDGRPKEWSNLVGIKTSDSLALTITWPAAAGVMGVNRTTGAAQVRLTYLEAMPETDAEVPKYFPHWVSDAWTPQQTYQDYGGSIVLPTGYRWRRVHAMTLLGVSPADVRSDGLAGTSVSGLAVKAADDRKPHQYSVIDFARRSQKGWHVYDDISGVPGAAATYGASTIAADHNPGVGFFDLGTKGGGDPSKVDPVFGTDLRNAREGAFRIGVTADATANVRVVYLAEGYGAY